MVFLKKYRQFILISILVLSFNNAFAQNSIKDLANKLEAMHMEIIDLGAQYNSGGNIANINEEFTSISNQLLEHKTLFERLKKSQSGWAMSEKLIFDADVKLRELQEKITLENNWGELRLRIIDFDNDNTEELKLKYDYGF